jgi:PAS domain S-box-containing protein
MSQVESSGPFDKELVRLFDQVADMFGVAGFDGYLKLVNSAWARTVGFSQEELLARPYIDIAHPDDVERIGEAVAGLAQGVELRGFVARIVCADGSVRWIDWNASAPPGEPYIYIFGRDVTDHLCSEAKMKALVDEQAALRRIATQVAEGVPPEEIFSAVSVEVSRLFGPGTGLPGGCAVVRFDDDGEIVIVGVAPPIAALPLHSRWTPHDLWISTRVQRTGRSARVDASEWLPHDGPEAKWLADLGIGSSVGSPIVVEGRLWGAITVTSTDVLPGEVADRLEKFTDLTAAAIANADSRAALRELAEEQAALRRVATHVAEGAAPHELFSAVSNEVSQLFGVPPRSVGVGGVVRFGGVVIRFDKDGELVVVGVSGPSDSGLLQSRWSPHDLFVETRVQRTGRSARVDASEWEHDDDPVSRWLDEVGIGSMVGSPIVVEGRLWGAITVTAPDSLASDVPARLEKFTALVATAIANADSRSSQRALADEQAALRRIAELAAAGAPPMSMFAAVADEVGRLLDVDRAFVTRLDDYADVTVLAVWNREGTWSSPELPLRRPAGPITRQLRETNKPVRFDVYEGDPTAVYEEGLRGVVAVPITVDGKLWGFVMVGSVTDTAPAPATEERLSNFTDLLGTAIANAETSEARQLLADKQEALRRVATLAAAGAPRMEIFAAVAEEVGLLLSVDHAYVTRIDDADNVTVLAGWVCTGLEVPAQFPLHLPSGPLTRGLRDGAGPIRIDPYFGDPAAGALEAGMRSAVSAPITVDGALWGFVTVASMTDRPPPPSTEDRLSDFTDLLGSAIADAESRESLARVAQEQAALRRVATFVARGADPSAVFDSVINEAADLFGADGVVLCRYEPGDEMVVLASSGPNAAEIPAGMRIEHEGENVAAIIRRTERPWRLQQYNPSDTSDLALLHRRLGVRSGVGAPVFVGGRLWGAIVARWTSDEDPPPDTEQRMVKFSQLIETAIANAEARREVTRLANEQASLRRVATLVANETSPDEVFAQVAEEAARVLGTVDCGVVRDMHDGTASVVAAYGAAISATFPVGSIIPLDEIGVVASVIRDCQPARIDDYGDATEAVEEGARARGIRSAVGAPIVVGGETWGAIVLAISEPQPCPPETEALLGQFADLVATTIANNSARAEIARLADEQAALRRIATLVAEGVSPRQIFDAVSEEVGHLFQSSTAVAVVERFDDDALVFEGVSGSLGGHIAAGTRWPLDESLVSSEVHRTGQSARQDDIDWSAVSGELGATVRRMAMRSTVSSPINVQGGLWGAISVTSAELLPDDTEERLVKFTELVATAIANADTRMELAASRRRIVAASDEARRRIERDLHDGMQQRLISLALRLRATEGHMPEEQQALRGEVASVASGLASAVDELQELSRGIHPEILTRGGLGPALRTLARRAHVPVELDVSVEGRLPEAIEVATYYVVSEALANATKYASATHVEITLVRTDTRVTFTICDDGVGGADPSRGTGLVGLADRVEALGGSLRVVSQPGDGTQITVDLPIEQPTVESKPWD